MSSRATALSILVAVAAMSSAVRAEPVEQQQATRTLWSEPDGTVKLEPCTPSSGQRTGICVVWTDGTHREATPTIAVSTGAINLIWQTRESEHEPNLLAFADSGGTALCGNYIAVLFKTVPHFQTISDCGQPTAALAHAPARSGRFGFDLFIPAGSTFGGPLSTARSAALPVIWHHGTFALDALRLQARPASATGDLRKEKAIANETRRFVEGLPLRNEGLPETTKAMLDLIVMGRAGKARKMLLQQADRRFDAARYWSDLCAGLVVDANWSTLLHDHLPQSHVIELSAKDGARHRPGEDYMLPTPRRGHD